MKKMKHQQQQQQQYQREVNKEEMKGRAHKKEIK